MSRKSVLSGLILAAGTAAAGAIALVAARGLRQAADLVPRTGSAAFDHCAEIANQELAKAGSGTRAHRTADIGDGSQIALIGSGQDAKSTIAALLATIPRLNELSRSEDDEYAQMARCFVQIVDTLRRVAKDASDREAGDVELRTRATLMQQTISEGIKRGDQTSEIAPVIANEIYRENVLPLIREEADTDRARRLVAEVHSRSSAAASGIGRSAALLSGSRDPDVLHRIRYHAEVMQYAVGLVRDWALEYIEKREPVAPAADPEAAVKVDGEPALSAADVLAKARQLHNTSDPKNSIARILSFLTGENNDVSGASQQVGEIIFQTEVQHLLNKPFGRDDRREKVEEWHSAAIELLDRETRSSPGAAGQRALVLGLGVSAAYARAEALLDLIDNHDARSNPLGTPTQDPRSMGNPPSV